MDEQKEKITEKVILSMTAKERHKAQEEVRNLLLKLYYKTTMNTDFKSKTFHLGLVVNKL